MQANFGEILGKQLHAEHRPTSYVRTLWHTDVAVTEVRSEGPTHEKLSLSHIALECGFANQSHFTRVFTSIVGLPPGAWRRE